MKTTPVVLVLSMLTGLLGTHCHLSSSARQERRQQLVWQLRDSVAHGAPESLDQIGKKLTWALRKASLFKPVRPGIPNLPEKRGADASFDRAEKAFSTGNFAEVKAALPSALRIYRLRAGESPGLGPCPVYPYPLPPRFRAALDTAFRHAPGCTVTDSANVLDDLGTCFRLRGNCYRALELHEQALLIRQRQKPGTCPCPAISLHGKGAALFGLGLQAKAVAEFNRALEYLDEKRYVERANLWFDIGTVWFDIAAYEQARAAFDTAAKGYVRALGNRHPQTARALETLGAAWYLTSPPEGVPPSACLDSTLRYCSEALLLRMGTLSAHSPDFANFYTALSILYENQRKYEDAIDMMGNSNRALLRSYGKNHAFAADQPIYTALVRIRQGYFEMALQEIKKAKAFLRYQKPFDFFPVRSVNYLVVGLRAEALARYKHFETGGGDIADLYRARDVAMEADSAVRYLRVHQERLLFSSDPLRKCFENRETSLRVSLALFRKTDDTKYLETSFAASEEARGHRLFEALRATESVYSPCLPKDMAIREANLRAGIIVAETLLREQEKSEESDSLRHVLNRLETAHKNLLDSIRQRYPSCYGLRLAPWTVALDRVQRDLLGPQQAMLEYFMGDSAVFLFVIRRDTVQLLEIPITEALKNQIDTIRHCLRGQNPNMTPLNRGLYLLYQTLIAPAMPHLMEIRRLVIIPDGILNYVPFEALLTNMPTIPGDYPNHPYLMRRFSIAYGHSATLLAKDAGNHKAPASKGNISTVLLFAPFCDAATDGLFDEKGACFSRLSASCDECLHIADRTKGTSIRGSAATFEAFAQRAPFFRILHLISHAQADDRCPENSRILFRKDDTKVVSLYLEDISRLQLDADLVSLTACESAEGPLRLGEGLVSLSGAFFLAGARSVAATRWRVEDSSTAYIMTEFYEQLAHGQPKDVAMQRAKLKFLTAQKMPFMARPTYWAAFALFGDTSALEFPKTR